jgi:hypothetical protein
MMGMTLAAMVFLAACLSTGEFKPVANLAALQVSFADTVWTGDKIPDGQQCNRFGGKGGTPKLVVKNIPAEANALILEFSDKTYMPMDNGCHGKIGYSIKPGAAEVTVPSVPGHTLDLPAGFFLVKAHCNPSWDKAGAYMPPCSGGQGNLYKVRVLAVFKAEGSSGESKLLGQAELTLGRY